MTDRVHMKYSVFHDSTGSYLNYSRYYDSHWLHIYVPNSWQFSRVICKVNLVENKCLMTIYFKFGFRRGNQRRENLINVRWANYAVEETITKVKNKEKLRPMVTFSIDLLFKNMRHLELWMDWTHYYERNVCWRSKYTKSVPICGVKIESEVEEII